MTYVSPSIQAQTEQADAAPHLHMMPPGALPAEITLRPTEAQAMRTTLIAFLAALEVDDPHSRAKAVRDVQRQTPPVPNRAAPPEPSRIPASRDDVVDFDTYFHVARVTAETPAATLLAGLLLCAADVTALAARGPDLPGGHVATQIAGFRTYAHLLARVCGLGILP